MTRIVIPTENQDGLNSVIAAHFGMAPFFTIVDLNADKEIVNIENSLGEQGNPMLALNFKPDIVITWIIGAGALQRFKNANIKVLDTQGTVVKEIIENFNKGILKELAGGSSSCSCQP